MCEHFRQLRSRKTSQILPCMFTVRCNFGACNAYGAINKEYMFNSKSRPFVVLVSADFSTLVSSLVD